MRRTKIEWTESTWNPASGCRKISAGCLNCYAATMAKRLQAMGNPKYANGFEYAEHPEELAKPYDWKAPHTVFVNSMSDLFFEKATKRFIKRVFKTMNENPRHTFQVLTKRAERLAEMSAGLTWTPNIWMGVTIERNDYVGRADLLRTTGARVKFVSLEPLLGPLPDLDLRGIDWAIVGGESGAGAREMKRAWVEDILKQCQREEVLFFFKQWGGVRKKERGRTLNGRT